MSIAKILNDVMGFVIKRRSSIAVGRGSRVRWWSLRGIRGGQLRIGQNCIINSRISFDSPRGSVSIGERCFLGASLLVCHSSITLGNDVIVSWGVTIVDHDSHSLDWRHRENDVADWAAGRKNWEGVSVHPVCIGDRVWIGFGASILKGVTVGEGAVIGANSVVTRDVPSFAVVAGNPARVVRQLTPEGERA